MPWLPFLVCLHVLAWWLPLLVFGVAGTSRPSSGAVALGVLEVCLLGAFLLRPRLVLWSAQLLLDLVGVVAAVSLLRHGTVVPMAAAALLLVRPALLLSPPFTAPLREGRAEVQPRASVSPPRGSMQR